MWCSAGLQVIKGICTSGKFLPYYQLFCPILVNTLLRSLAFGSFAMVQVSSRMLPLEGSLRRGRSRRESWPRSPACFLNSWQMAVERRWCWSRCTLPPWTCSPLSAIGTLCPGSDWMARHRHLFDRAWWTGHPYPFQPDCMKHF